MSNDEDSKLFTLIIANNFAIRDTLQSLHEFNQHFTNQCSQLQSTEDVAIMTDYIKTVRELFYDAAEKRIQVNICVNDILMNQSLRPHVVKLLVDACLGITGVYKVDIVSTLQTVSNTVSQLTTRYTENDLIVFSQTLSRFLTNFLQIQNELKEEDQNLKPTLLTSAIQEQLVKIRNDTKEGQESEWGRCIQHFPLPKIRESCPCVIL